MAAVAHGIANATALNGEDFFLGHSGRRCLLIRQYRESPTDRRFR